MAPRSAIHRPQTTVAWAVAYMAIVALAAALFWAPASAWAAGAGPAFPRLAVWWPNNHTQSPAVRARCDWIALQGHDSDHIAELRAANPDIIVLGSTSARELNYSLESYDHLRNIELRAASTDWILTQVGCTLTGNVDPTTTSIPVSDVRKFAVGEMVLVDRELMSVEAIGSSKLTVMRRGCVNPASSHVAGTRIASVVTAWPGGITFDLSTNCPKADVGYGPETWREWNARRARGVLDSADWDGLFIDTLETDPTWMVSTKHIRSIDPLRTNRSLTGDFETDYATFNAAWAAGAVEFGSDLRAACGDRILIGNGNVRNPEFNGNIFEDFPHTGLTTVWWERVFTGRWPFPHASYPEWLAESASPNLTMIQTYGPSDDFRAMRYGLCTALMGDGYFSYAPDGSGHSKLGIDWFDEYDNAGAGRGYLGQPTGAALKSGGVWRRDYEGGIALVNPTDSALTVQLGGAFAKIDGTQDRIVNNGALVDSVSIPAHDGLVLRRVPVLGLSASTTALTYGLETTLQVSASAALASEITIEHREAGTAEWKAAATATAGVDGLAAVAQRPLVTTEYRARIAGTSALSRTVSVGVRPRVSIKASRSKVAKYRRVTISGAVTHPGRVAVKLQRLVRGSWKTVRRMLTSSSGRYSTTVKVGGRATLRYRVRASADPSHLTGTSSTLRILVR